MNSIETTHIDWINTPKGEAFQSLVAQVNEYRKSASKTINDSTLKGLVQYSGRAFSSIYSSGYLSDVDINAQLGVSPSLMKIAFNLTASVIDTLVAKLASIESVPQAVTYKGNYKGKKLAEDINFIVKGLFHKYDLANKINMVYRDAMINRNGYLKVSVVDNEVIVDRVLSNEIIVDSADGYYGEPYKMIQVKEVPLHVAIAKWPKHKDDFLSCSVKEKRQYDGRNFTACITIVEAWCKNSYVKGGRHVICVENATIVDEKWDKDYFPIIPVYYNKPVIGFIGSSVVDELDPIQKEIDRILASMQAILKLMSVPRIFIDMMSDVNPEHITNEVGMIVKYNGAAGVAPVIHNGASMPPELPEQLQFLISQGYARVGLTSMDTQGQKQAGLDSGEAIKTMQDVKSERWQLLQRSYERTYVDLATLILKELQGTDIKISAMDRSIGLVQISTKRIPKTDDSYILQIFPVSALPDSIPDRIDSVQKMLQLGVIPVSVVPELFKMPDIDSYMVMQAAPRKFMEKKIEEMLDTGKQFIPEPYHDLDYALTFALQLYNFSQMHDVEDKKLKILRSFIDDVRQMQAQRIQPAQQQQVQQQGVQSNGQTTSSNQPTQQLSQGS